EVNMTKLFLLPAILSLLTTILTPACAFSEKLPEKTYVLRVTANEASAAIPFNATYMAITNQGTKVDKIKQTTPYEYAITANYIGVVLEIDHKNPQIKVDIAEKQNNYEDVKLTGAGHAIFAHESVNGNGYILA